MVLSKLDIVVDDLDVVGGEGMGSVGSELSLKYTSKTAVRNACANLVIKTFPNCWLIENATTMSIIRLSYLPSTPPLTLTYLSVNSCRTRSCRRKSRHFAEHGSFPRAESSFRPHTFLSFVPSSPLATATRYSSKPGRKSL